MMGPWLLGVFASLPPDGYLPCTPGLRLSYRIETNGVDTGTRVVDEVRGTHSPRLCIIDRTTTSSRGAVRSEAYALEHLPDRVLSAGWWPHLVAFRIPLLRSPLVRDARWRFGGVAYRVVSENATVHVPAGRFARVLVVEEHAVDGSEYRASVSYAPGLGPIQRREHRRHGSSSRILIAVDRPRKRQSKPSLNWRDGPSRRVVSPSAKP